MRRRRLFFAACGLTALAASLTAACGAEDAAPSGTRIDADASASIRGPAAPVPPAAGQRRIAVVYFSEPETEDRRAVQGNTEFIASVIGKATGGALYRIERSAPYPSSHEALTAEAKEERDRGARPAIQGPGDLSEVDTVFLGYPIWWYDMPMPVYSFLEAYDLSGKTIIPFVTHGGSGLTGTADRIAAAGPADPRCRRRSPPCRTTSSGTTISASACGRRRSPARPPPMTPRGGTSSSAR